MELRAIAIDDDPVAIMMIEQMIKKTPNVVLINSYTDAVEGAAGIILDQPDLLFLDMDMPDFNGLDIMGALVKRPKIIVISANEDYEPEAKKLDAVAFFHKPFPEHPLSELLEKLHLDTASQSAL